MDLVLDQSWRLNFDPKWISFLIKVGVAILIQRGSRFCSNVDPLITCHSLITRHPFITRHSLITCHTLIACHSEREPNGAQMEPGGAQMEPKWSRVELKWSSNRAQWSSNRFGNRSHLTDVLFRFRTRRGIPTAVLYRFGS